MKTTTTKRTKKNPHDAANEELDAMMTEGMKEYWKEMGEDEKRTKG